MPTDHLPPPFVQRMIALLGEEAPAFFAHYDAPPDIGLRVNTLKLAPEEYRALSPFDLDPLPWNPTGYRVLKSDSSPGIHVTPGSHLHHAAGLYYLQDLSAQAVAEVLDPQPGERILDLAAAPGGKTTHIAAKMQNRGVLVANEIHPKRVWDLARNLERWGARNVLIANETPERLAARLSEYFDRVLVDAPCSGEGMFRKMPEAVRDWSPEFVAGCAIRQTAILDTAAELVRPGGWLCYATCTFAPQEDEHIIARFLDDHADFELVTPAWKPGFSPALSPLPSSAGAGGPRPYEASSPQAGRGPGGAAIRLWPHLAPGEGHFIALLRRSGSAEASVPEPARPAHGLKNLLPYWEAFRAHALHLELPTETLHLVKSFLYALPPDSPDMAGLNIVRPGWWLGSFKKDRFEPSHALALALLPAEARRTVSLDAAAAGRYLHREAFRADGEDGWVLVTLDGRFPLGWGKRVRGLVKNHYPSGLRLL